jgi:hypothetical protein
MQDIFNKNFANNIINKLDINDYIRATSTSMYQIRASKV